MNKNIFKKILRPILIAIFWLAIWQILYLIIGRELIIPSPFDVLKTILQLGSTAAFWQNIVYSIIRILAGYITAVLLGIVVGILTAKSKLLNAVLAPIAKIIRATPVASFIILLFVFMTRNHIPAFTAFLMVFPLIWANVYEGIRNCDVQLLEMAFVYKLSFRHILFHIYVPSVMPYFMAAAKTGMGMAWKAGIAAEVLTSPTYGIGAALYRSKIYIETTETFAWTAVIIIISVILEKLFSQLMNRLYFNDSQN